MIKLRKRNICIVGVDGSGKSTTIEKLKEVFGEKVTIQYMGYRNYENKYISKRIERTKDSKNKIIILSNTFLQWTDFWKRYLSVRYKSSFVIFDRYPDEACITFGKFGKIVSKILFKILFPHPKKIYYLYCRPETSFSRKDDIIDKELFKDKKKKFDKYYMPGTKSFSTDKCSTDEIISYIISDFNEKCLRYFS